MKKFLLWGSLLFGVILITSGCQAGKSFYEKGIAQAQKGDFAEAAKSMEKAIQENGERAEYYIGYGMILNEQGEYQKAVEQFERAYQDTENSIANSNNKQVFYGEAISYYYLSEYETSLEYCDKALGFTAPVSLDGDILCSKGAVLEAMGDTDQARKCYDQAIKKEPENWQAYLKRGDLRERQGDAEEAKKDYLSVIHGKGKERYEAGFKLYELCQTEGDLDTGEQILGEIIGTESEDAFVLCQIGRAYGYRGDKEQAEKYLEQSQEKGYGDAGYYLGIQAMEQGDLVQARTRLESYLSQGKGTLLALAYNQLAGCAMAEEDLGGAWNYIEQGLAVADGNSRRNLWRNQIVLLEKQGKFGQAKKEAKQYLQSYPQEEDMGKELEFIKTRQKKGKKKKSKKEQESAS